MLLLEPEFVFVLGFEGKAYQLLLGKWQVVCEDSFHFVKAVEQLIELPVVFFF